MKKNKTVLVIDDDESLRRVMEFTLHESGFKVVTAENGIRGLEIFKNLNPEVVVTDIQMPEMSGYDLLREIKSVDNDCLVIMITAFATIEQAVNAMKDGAFDYITKPFGNDELVMVVERALSYLNLQTENERLKQQLVDRVDFDHLIGISDVMQQVFDMVRRVASSDATVLIGGESGTGKELVAKAIHNGSDRANGPFVPVNCAAIPRELLESELFGHVKGSFTGAIKDRIGKFELADGGTLFLDEVGEMSPELQPKLLRALQEMEIEPVGSGQVRKIDVRVVAASNRDLELAIKDNRFREDLYYRLAVIPLELPPLRERKTDIPVLIRHFLDKLGGEDRLDISAGAAEAFVRYEWPGNVRELENAIEQMVILRQGETIEVSDLPPKFSDGGLQSHSAVVSLPPTGYPLAELEKEIVVQALDRCNWNQTRAAAFLHIPRHTLVYRMEKYQLKKLCQ